MISFASPKGGAGKSTSAVLLACEFAQAGRKVTVIDADPNRPVFRWAQRPGKPDNLTVLQDVTEETIIDTIESATAGSSFVIVDLEGTASIMVALAISRADLVVIPSQGSHLDAEQAARAVQLVRMNEKRFRVAIPMAVLFTRTSAAIRTRDLKRIEANFAKAGVSVFNTRLTERAPYRALFAYGGTLASLDPSQVSGISQAQENAKAYAEEALSILQSQPVRKVA